MPDEKTIEETPVEETEALPPIDPEKAHESIEDLVRLDWALRDQGSSLVSILRHLASTSQGIKL